MGEKATAAPRGRRSPTAAALLTLTGLALVPGSRCTPFDAGDMWVLDTDIPTGDSVRDPNATTEGFMDARVDEIADGIYRISTCIPEAAPGGFTFNQFVIDAEEPLLYHTGMRGLFPLVSAALARVGSLDRLRWIAFSHVEADECGAVNEFLAAAPHAQVVHGQLGVVLSLSDLCDRPPCGLADGDVLDIGGAQLQRRMVEVATPHVPHNWESHLFYEQVTGTLFCGDLGTQIGDGDPVTSEDLVPGAIAAEEHFRQTSLGPAVGSTYRRLAELQPATLAIMHGSSYSGDCAGLLRSLAEVYDGMALKPATPAQPLPAHDS